MLEKILGRTPDDIREGKHRSNSYFSKSELEENFPYVILGTRKNKKEVDYFIGVFIYTSKTDWSNITTLNEIYYFDDYYDGYFYYMYVRTCILKGEY